MKVSDRIAQIDDILEDQDQDESIDLRSDDDDQQDDAAIKSPSMIEREEEEQKVLDELKDQIA